MKKLAAEDPETKSPDLVAETIEQLKALSPDAFTEGKTDFEVLKQHLGGVVDEREEKYGLNWHGKRRARKIALTPSTGTLRPCSEESVDWGTTQNSESCRDRLRRAASKTREESPMFAGDLGFRVFKLASTNIRAWDPSPDDLVGTLRDHVEHLKADPTEQDILFELLLKLGLDLTVPMEQKTLAGKTVHCIGAGTLLVCLAEKISRKEVEPLALGIVDWHKAQTPSGGSTVVFRDNAFADDVAKTNLTAILDQQGISNVRSL